MQFNIHQQPPSYAEIEAERLTQNTARKHYELLNHAAQILFMMLGAALIFGSYTALENNWTIPDAPSGLIYFIVPLFTGLAFAGTRFPGFFLLYGYTCFASLKAIFLLYPGQNIYFSALTGTAIATVAVYVFELLFNETVLKKYHEARDNLLHLMWFSRYTEPERFNQLTELRKSYPDIDIYLGAIEKEGRSPVIGEAKAIWQYLEQSER